MDSKINQLFKLGLLSASDIDNYTSDGYVSDTYKYFSDELKIDHNHVDGFNRYASDALLEYNQSIEEGLDFSLKALQAL